MGAVLWGLAMLHHCDWGDPSEPLLGPVKSSSLVGCLLVQEHDRSNDWVSMDSYRYLDSAWLLTWSGTT